MIQCCPRQRRRDISAVETGHKPNNPTTGGAVDTEEAALDVKVKDKPGKGGMNGVPKGKGKEASGRTTANALQADQEPQADVNQLVERLQKAETTLKNMTKEDQRVKREAAAERKAADEDRKLNDVVDRKPR